MSSSSQNTLSTLCGGMSTTSTSSVNNNSNNNNKKSDEKIKANNEKIQSIVTAVTLESQSSGKDSTVLDMISQVQVNITSPRAFLFLIITPSIPVIFSRA